MAVVVGLLLSQGRRCPSSRVSNSAAAAVVVVVAAAQELHHGRPFGDEAREEDWQEGEPPSPLSVRA